MRFSYRTTRDFGRVVTLIRHGQPNVFFSGINITIRKVAIYKAKPSFVSTTHVDLSIGKRGRCEVGRDWPNVYHEAEE